MDKEYKVEYADLKDLNTVLTATFPRLEDAQLWWESVVYLRNVYMIVSTYPR